MPDVTCNRKLTFKKPTIGRKHYNVVGSSGWLESFAQTECDQALATLIGHVPVEELAGNFLAGVKLKPKKAWGWNEVIGYLSRIFNIDSDSVPIPAAIGFWAHIVKNER